MKSNENPKKLNTVSVPEEVSPKNQNTLPDNSKIPSILLNNLNLNHSSPQSSSNRSSSEKSRSNDSIEFIEIGAEEKINIKKVVKYKEIDNKYIKGEVLGQGQFAKVRDCIDKRSLKRYAVKIMKKHYLRRLGPNVKKNVEKEVQLVSKLNHKNVMKMFHSFSTDKKIYIFMEYCAGVLSEMINFAPNHMLPKWQSHHYFCQLIDGLKYLHSLGVYHRDIKDENLLIDNSHVIKIADFGVSFVLDLLAENDLIIGYEGTKLYQPPEVLNEKYSGSKFDIWSSGVLLFKMVSGLHPFFNGKEDIYDKNSYRDLKYPEIIQKDKQLLDLLQKIFNLDFNDRITIKGIKDHPWVRLKHNMNGREIGLPVRTVGDIYRGMTLIERLRVKFEYDYPVNTEPEFVNLEEYEESLKPHDSNVRTDRSPTRRLPKEKLKPFRRLTKMGLLG